MILPFWRKRLQVAQEIEPLLVLTFYKHAIMLRKGAGAGLTEYPIDPSALATLLAEKIGMSARDCWRKTRCSSDSLVW